LEERWSSKLKAQYLFILRFAQDAYPDNDLVHDWSQFLSVSVYRNRWGIAISMANFFIEQKYGEHGLMKVGRRSVIHDISSVVSLCIVIFS
jgi:hypothetical protein